MLLPKTLDASQSALLQRIADVLASDASASGVALGGSFARGHAAPQSDLDVVLYYDEARPPNPAALAHSIAALHPDHEPRFTAPGAWGPFVDGGAWLTFSGQRVDVLYRSLDRVQRILDDCSEGRWELHWAQQPPYGYFSPAFIEELAIGIPMRDRDHRLAHLQAKARTYPSALQRSLVQALLWNAEFTLSAFAPKHVRDADVYGFAGCATRVVFVLTQVMFALHLRWPVPDRQALRVLTSLERAPSDFGPRLVAALAAIGSSAATLNATLTILRGCFDDVCALAGALYVPQSLP